MTRILVVDDEPQIRRALRTTLTAHDYDVTTVDTGEAGVTGAEHADIVLLDLGLPDIDGSEVIGRIRGFSQLPIIVLSVRGGQSEKVRALDAGADDYLTKPFSMEELLARTRAALRRAQEPAAVQPVRRFGQLEVDLARSIVTSNGTPLKLTRREFALLTAFVTNPGILLTHRWLLMHVWGSHHTTDIDALRHAVRALRKRLGDTAAAPELITTEPGLGYRWIGEPAG